MYSVKEQRHNRKALYLWSLAGRKAVRVIEATRPFLIVKHKQADIVLALYKSRDHKQDAIGKILHLRARLTEKQFEENRKAVTAIRELNTRGITA